VDLSSFFLIGNNLMHICCAALFLLVFLGAGIEIYFCGDGFFGVIEAVEADDLG